MAGKLNTYLLWDDVFTLTLQLKFLEPNWLLCKKIQTFWYKNGEFVVDLIRKMWTLLQKDVIFPGPFGFVKGLTYTITCQEK